MSSSTIKAMEPSASPMNVIIPMGGVGSRFTKDSYRFPKPLVNIAGRPMLFWIIDNLSLASNDIVWIGIMEQVDMQFGVTTRLRREYPHLDIRRVHLKFFTRGAAETLFTIMQNMTDGELERRTISLDCDTIYFCDVLTAFRQLPGDFGCSLYFEDTGGKPIYSYISLDGEKSVTSIREKQAISRWANTGGYGFRSGQALRDFCQKLIDGAVGKVGEYYTSQIIDRMLGEGEGFKGIYVPRFECVGTPAQLQEFLVKIRTCPPGTYPVRKTRFCFDLDNTLVTYPVMSGDFSTVEAIPRNVGLLRDLKAAGHVIIIYTSRGMRENGGSMGAAMKDVARVTFDTLEKFGIPYDEIYFGKPDADVFVDDLAVNALVDTESELGWLCAESEKEKGFGGNAFITPRHFNNLFVMGDKVVKSAHRDIIAGEIFFYENMPEDIKDMFPTVISTGHSQHEGMEPMESDVLSVTLSKIPGVTFTHLVINRCVTEKRLVNMLTSLLRLHNSDGKPVHRESDADAARPPASTSIYVNYASKVEERYDKYRDVYQAVLGTSSGVEIYPTVLEYLRGYEAEGRGLHRQVIHGDPVFSNALLTGQNEVIFLDMRGALGGELTTEGDALYDLSKVYQSLCGYDYVLLDQPLLDADVQLLGSLRAVFVSFVCKHYPGVRVRDIEMITASHYLSLIPLHKNTSHHIKFYQFAVALARSDSP